MAIPTHTPLLPCRAGATAAPTLLGQGPSVFLPAAVRAGIKVLTKKAAEQPQAKAIYDQGVAAGQSASSEIPSAPSPKPFAQPSGAAGAAQCRGSPCGRRSFPTPRSPGRFWTPMARIGAKAGVCTASGGVPPPTTGDRDAHECGGLGQA